MSFWMARALGGQLPGCFAAAGIFFKLNLCALRLVFLIKRERVEQ